MAEALTIYKGKQAIAETDGLNYKVTCPWNGDSVELVRDVDFQIIPQGNSKQPRQPSLLKSGAEKVVSAYNLLVRFSMETKIENEVVQTENGTTPLFFYNVRCDLINIANDGTEYVFSTGFGSANTSERRNGFADPFTQANSALKMAQKRALVQAALTISGLSSLFSQDIENETFMKKFDELNDAVKNGTVTEKQMKLIYATASDLGISARKIKEKLVEWGFKSIKAINQNELDDVLNKIKALKEA